MYTYIHTYIADPPPPPTVNSQPSSVFAAILFLFELCQFKYVACIDNVFRRNFGFMYGSRAKALYIIL